MKPHKHCEVIKAWADGHEIERRGYGQAKWSPVAGDPLWYEDVDYRVKPQTKRYRMFVCTADGSIGVANDVEPLPSEIRWLGDWQEVDV